MEVVGSNPTSPIKRKIDMEIKYCVITEIRRLEDVLADDLLLELDEGLVVWEEIPNRFIPGGKERTGKTVKVAVFDEGEILICDEAGVEIGAMRKPWNWRGAVTYEIFDNVEDAVKKSLEVRKAI